MARMNVPFRRGALTGRSEDAACHQPRRPPPPVTRQVVPEVSPVSPHDEAPDLSNPSTRDACVACTRPPNWNESARVSHPVRASVRPSLHARGGDRAAASSSSLRCGSAFGRWRRCSRHPARPLPCRAVASDPAVPGSPDRHPAHLENAAVRACAVPMPLGPLNAAGLGCGEHFGPDIGDLAKQRCPVPPYLVGPAKLSPGVDGLRAVIVVVETGYEGVDVVRVDCCAERVGQHAHSLQQTAARAEVLSRVCSVST